MPSARGSITIYSGTALGLSCAIIGLGMALDFNLFKKIMSEITAVGGFDKEMELRLLRKRIRFGYAEDICCLDEKTAHQSDLKINAGAGCQPSCII